MFNNLTVVYSLTDKNFKIDGEPKVWIDQTRNLLPSQAEERDRLRRRERGWEWYRRKIDKKNNNKKKKERESETKDGEREREREFEVHIWLPYIFKWLLFFCAAWSWSNVSSSFSTNFPPSIVSLFQKVENCENVSS